MIDYKPVCGQCHYVCPLLGQPWLGLGDVTSHATFACFAC